MHFRSFFVLSTLWVFGFPIAVPKEGNSDEALSVRDDVLGLEDFSDPLATSPPPTSDISRGGDVIDQPVSAGVQLSSNSPGSTLLAQNAYSNGDANDPVTGAILGGLGLGVDLFLDRIHEVNQVLQDDHPNVKVTGVNPLIKTPRKDEQAPQAGAAARPAGVTPDTGTGGGKPGSADPCPRLLYEPRLLAWCDLGERGSVEIKRTFIRVNGSPCGFCSH